tara:strand:- start:1585 stop:1833 length:249 start_codon:yes stop_codon:yes gene_type:complete
MTSVASKISDIVEKALDSSIREILTPESLLLEDGMLDSFGLISLIAEIEDEFSIAMDVEDLTSQNFASVNDIAVLVEGYMKK